MARRAKMEPCDWIEPGLQFRQIVKNPARSLVSVESQANFELTNGLVGGSQRILAMAAEVASRAFDVRPSMAQRLDRFADFRVPLRRAGSGRRNRVVVG